MRIRDLAEEAISPSEAFVSAILAQADACEALPFALTYYPVAAMNPFQRLLYTRGAHCGYAVVPGMQFHHLGRVHWRDRSVIHLHWLASVLRGVATPSAARSRLAGMKADLAAWRASGHRIVWSMHNVLPHDCQFPEAEVELRRVLVEGVDAIHVLSEASVDEARSHYDVPGEKVFHVPHPSYEGWYANVDDRTTARLDLDIPADAFTFLFFGSLQPYKGVLELIDAFAALRERHPGRPLRLVVAGKAVDPDYAARIQEIAGGDSSIRFIPSAMEERQLQTLFHAADVVVAPYLRTLNSGVALLAATFRRPLVAPRRGGVLETFQEDPTLLYEDAEGGLIAALERSMSHCIPEGVFDRLLQRHHPASVSESFFKQMTQRLFAGEIA